MSALLLASGAAIPPLAPVASAPSAKVQVIATVRARILSPVTVQRVGGQLRFDDTNGQVIPRETRMVQQAPRRDGAEVIDLF